MPVGLHFIQAKGAATALSLADTLDSYTIEVDNSTGFLDGDLLGVFCSTGEYCFTRQIGAPVGNIITVGTPLQRKFAVGCNVLNFTSEMAVNGTLGVGGREVFQIGPVGSEANVVVEITRLLGVITCAQEPDDSKFGHLAQLARGCVLRKNNDEYLNYANFRVNGDIAMFAGSPINYTDKAGGGVYSAAFELPFAGQSKHGVAVRLDPGDTLEMLIQDDLSGISSFRMLAEGHIALD